ncbi:MAG: transketolase C-terminal domain-containing protein [Alphaproteobacteria bacterium]
MRKVAMNMVHALARQDPRVVFIGSDLGAGTLDEMKAEMPDRFFMEGVSEQQIIGMAAGMAMDGLIPYINTIATFLTRRCYEQVAVDLCLHRLPVRLIASGGGLVYAPLGPTHMAIEDIAIMRALPNMTVVAPCDAAEMERLMRASLDWPDPMYIRLAKGGDEVVSDDKHGFEIGKAIALREGDDVMLVSTGVMTQRALAAAETLKEAGIEAGVLHVHTVKPLDDEAILNAAKSARLMVTLEEHTLVGGLGSAVGELLLDRFGRERPMLKRLGLTDAFTEHYGSQEELLQHYGLAPAQIAATVETLLRDDASRLVA